MGKETQKILIYTDFSVVGEKSIEWGLFFAERFEKDYITVRGLTCVACEKKIEQKLKSTPGIASV